MATLRFILISVSIFLLAAVTVIPATAQQKKRASGTTLPANTYFRLRMNQEISSENARIGDKFSAEVVTPVYHGSKEIVPAGSTVTGKVTSVQRAQGKGKPGSFGVT